MAKTNFQDKDPQHGIPGTVIRASHCNGWQNHQHLGIDDDGYAPVIEEPVLEVNQDVVLDKNNVVVLVDASNNNVQITLPSIDSYMLITTPKKAQKHFIKRIDASNYSVTIVPSTGDKIEGLNSINLKQKYSYFSLYAKNKYYNSQGNWLILSESNRAFGSFMVRASDRELVVYGDYSRPILRDVVYNDDYWYDCQPIYFGYRPQRKGKYYLYANVRYIPKTNTSTARDEVVLFITKNNSQRFLIDAAYKVDFYWSNYDGIAMRRLVGAIILPANGIDDYFCVDILARKDNQIDSSGYVANDNENPPYESYFGGYFIGE